jgi:hypothetical protein
MTKLKLGKTNKARRTKYKVQAFGTSLALSATSELFEFETARMSIEPMNGAFL